MRASPSTAPPIPSSCSRARGRTTAGRPSCARQSPQRRAGLIVAPILGDIDGAIAEITRAHGEGLWGGVIIPAQWGEYPSYTNYRYDPIWELCESLSLPVHTHSGPAAHADYGAVPGVLGLYATETVWWTSRPMWFLLWSGVFERFPKLKMAVTESGSYWAPDMLWRMDSLILRTRVRASSTTASRDCSRCCRASTSTATAGSDRRTRAAASWRDATRSGSATSCGATTSPIPRARGRTPRRSSREAFWDIPVDETAQILGLNAAEFYGFDVDALRPIAEEIGPTPDELGQTDPAVLAKWDDLRAAGRHWLTGREAVPVAP